jgi:hypothetical protein
MAEQSGGHVSRARFHEAFAVGRPELFREITQPLSATG